MLVVLATGAAKPVSPPQSLAAVHFLHDPPLRLELMQDARITPATQRDLEAAHWFGVTRSRKLEQLLAARPMSDAVVRLVSPQGKVLLRAALETPFATLERLPAELAVAELFLLVARHSGFGQDVVATGQVLTVDAAGLRAVGAADEDGRIAAIRLLRGGKNDWRLLVGEESGGAILQAQCVVDGSRGEGFREVFTAYHATAQGWRQRRREAPGWCDWPDGFPPVSAFP